MKTILRHTATALLLLAAATATAQDYTEGANTYIITTEGEHSFLPLHVDGTPIDIASADWLWAEKDPAENGQTMISNVRLEDGKVKFDYSATREGNALIAGFDAQGTIVWTWLIWCTDRPYDYKLDNGNYFQDRLLGAVGPGQGVTTPHGHPEAWSPIGYQWGRPVPTFNGYSNETAAAMSEPKQYTQINPTYADSHAWTVELGQAVSMETAIANPTVWYTDLNNTENWYTSEDNTLWSASEKTNYDPCPEGYKVPDEKALGNFATKAQLANVNGYTYTNTDGEESWWQGCGSGRYWGDGKYDAMGSASSTPIYYHLSDQYTGWGTPYPKRILLQTDPSAAKLAPYSGSLRCANYNIRCVRYKGDAVTAIRRVDAAEDLTVKAQNGHIEAYFPAGQYTRLTVADAAGRTLAATTIPAGATQATLSAPQAQHGFYIVKAQNGHRAVARKLLQP